MNYRDIPIKIRCLLGKMKEIENCISDNIVSLFEHIHSVLSALSGLTKEIFTVQKTSK